MTRKGLSLDNLLADMGLDTAEDGLSNIEVWTVWREEKKGVAIGSDGVPDPLGFVELGIVH